MTEADVAAWVVESRLNLLRGLPDHASEPQVQDAVKRFIGNAGAAIERLKQLDEARSPKSDPPS